ncbi:hypothetical protein [Vibrio splendidus]|uniref:hypothetical protein n=1 Tax=Vibrio splendidus TaxID=29497 RepID=UPI0021B3224D|nr:hypothetical protein [Vibrio splendidus]UWZ99125.1 hypothetical protein IM698_07215 [Vibrio splendidus]
MKKLILAAIISSVTFGANAAWQSINFDNLNRVSNNEVDLVGKVKKRCLVRVGDKFAVRNVLKNARATASGVNTVTTNDAVTVGHLRAWCNYGSNLKVKVEKTDLMGIGTDNGGDHIRYRVNIGGLDTLGLDRAMKRIELGSTSGHLENSVSRHEISVTPEHAGFARAGEYTGKIKFRLTAQ